MLTSIKGMVSWGRYSQKGIKIQPPSASPGPYSQNTSFISLPGLLT